MAEGKLYSLQLDKVEAHHHHAIENSKARIAKYCEQYPNIRLFVEAVLNFDEPWGTGASLPRVLRTLFWEISQMELKQANPDTLCSLASFVGNYFLDDSYFILEKDRHGFWRGRSYDDEGSTQNPLALIRAAEENVKWYQDWEEKSQVIHHGVVEGYGPETIIPHPTSPGWTLRCPAYPAPCNYVRFCDEEENEHAYWCSDEWKDAPEEVMGAIMGVLRLVRED